MANGIRVNVSWPSDLGEPGFAPGGQAPMNPSIEQLLEVRLFALKHVVAPGGQQAGKNTVYETIPVELSDQRSWQLQPGATAGGLRTETIMVAAASMPSTVAVTVQPRRGTVWSAGAGLPSGYRIRFIAPPSQRIAGSTAEEYAVVNVVPSASPMGETTLTGEARP